VIFEGVVSSLTDGTLALCDCTASSRDGISM